MLRPRLVILPFFLLSQLLLADEEPAPDVAAPAEAGRFDKPIRLAAADGASSIAAPPGAIRVRGSSTSMAMARRIS
jgi:hypothetical protein